VQTKSQKETSGEIDMKKSLFVLGVGALVIIAAASAQQAHKAPSAARKVATKKVVYSSSSEASFKPAAAKGVSQAVVWGNPDKGAHGTYTKFEPGVDVGMHTHTNDVWIVGIKGAYLYKDDAGEKRVGPGDFLRVPGGHKHSSAGDKTESALFYEEGSAKFDLIPAK